VISWCCCGKGGYLCYGWDVFVMVWFNLVLALPACLLNLAMPPGGRGYGTCTHVRDFRSTLPGIIVPTYL
jgi:hypothetical protein